MAKCPSVNWRKLLKYACSGTPASKANSRPLNVDDFLKKTTLVRYTPERLRRDAPHVAQLARAEGLEAHARAVEIRLA